jgi:putative iron-dependent peroxidase
VPIDAQSVDAPLSRFAVFLVVTVGADDDSLARVREVISGIDDLVKTVGFRDLGGHLSCVVGVGRRLWDRLVPGIRPTELEVFPVVGGPVHTAPSTPGDLLFHIRAERVDLCFELERLLLDALGTAVRVEDETQGFRYFDARDLLGFVDGTANPIGSELGGAAIISDEDPRFAGGSYVVVQKYVHDLGSWGSLTVEQQEAVIGRTKLENIELDDNVESQKAHKTLTTITDDNGDELEILRDNMPFGSPGSGEMGTYFIGYSARLWVTMRMIERMFIGDPPGYYDKILDVSRAVTGSTFFVPSNGVLQALGDPESLTDAFRLAAEPSSLSDERSEESKGGGTDALRLASLAQGAESAVSADGSLGIGSLHDGSGTPDGTEGTAS